MESNLKDLIGKNIQLHAQRIMKGNPVKGKLLSVDDEWIEVELLHTIEGMVNEWGEGENKMFRISLTSQLKTI